MSHQEPPISAEDQALRQAVAGAWGGERATDDLRRRVAMAMTRTVLEEPEIRQTSRSWWDRVPARVRTVGAVAACLLVAVGGAWGLLSYGSGPSVDYAEVAAMERNTPAMKQTLYGLLVSRHVEYASGEEAGEAIGGERLQALREALASQMRHPVWAPDLAKAGFKFHSLNVYPVNGSNVVSLTFRRGPAAVSIVSLPVRSEGCPGSEELDLFMQDAALEGFSSGGNLFAMIGTRISQADLKALSTQFRNDPTSGIGSCGIH